MSVPLTRICQLLKSQREWSEDGANGLNSINELKGLICDLYKGWREIFPLQKVFPNSMI